MAGFFLAWGSNTKQTRVGATGSNHQCFYCDNIGSQGLFKKEERGHLFFIPLPIKRDAYELFCPNCKGVYDLSPAEAEQIKQEKSL